MSSRIRQAGRLVPLLLVVLIGSLVGCFAARNPAPLAPSEPTVSRVPILPVLASQVRITVTPAEGRSSDELSLSAWPRESRNQVADLINEILDDLTRDHPSLVGPSRVLCSLPESSLERLHIYVDDPGPFDEAWKVRGLKEIGLDLDTDKVVQVRVQMLLEEQAPAEGTISSEARWRGEARVSAELLGLSPVASLALGDGQDRLWGNVGVLAEGGYGGAIVVPYGFGRGLGKSLDNAARQALRNLLAATGEVP